MNLFFQFHLLTSYPISFIDTKANMHNEIDLIPLETVPNLNKELLPSFRIFNQFFFGYFLLQLPRLSSHFYFACVDWITPSLFAIWIKWVWEDENESNPFTFSCAPLIISPSHFDLIAKIEESSYVLVLFFLSLCILNLHFVAELHNEHFLHR